MAILTTQLDAAALSIMLLGTTKEKEGQITYDESAYTETLSIIPFLDIFSISSYIDESVKSLLRGKHLDCEISSEVTLFQGEEKHSDMYSLFLMPKTNKYFLGVDSKILPQLIQNKKDKHVYGYSKDKLLSLIRRDKIFTGEPKNQEYYNVSALRTFGTIPSELAYRDHYYDHALEILYNNYFGGTDLEKVISIKEFEGAVYRALSNFESINDKSKSLSSESGSQSGR